MKAALAVSVTTLILISGCSSSSEDAAAPSSAAASASAVASAAVSDLPANAMSAKDLAALQKTVDDYQAQMKSELPSLMVGVWDPEKGYGQVAAGDAVMDPARVASVEDQFRIASVTKTFVATVVLQLVAEGKLDLDKPVSDYAPELATKYPEIGAVTIRQLLAMKSGLPDFEKRVTSQAAVDPAARTKVWTGMELIDTAMSNGKVKPAGKSPAVYTNTNYVVLGQVVEAVTGQDMQTLVEDRILAPLALARTAYPPASDTALTDPHSDGYLTPGAAENLNGKNGTLKPNENVTDWSASWGNAAGTMSSTVGDLGKWAATDFGSDLLPAGLAKQRMQTTKLSELGQGDYGLGIQKLGDWIGHEGGIPGWDTLAVRDPKTGAIVVMSSNSTGQYGPLTHLALLSQLYPKAPWNDATAPAQ